MTKTQITAGALFGVILTGSLVGAVSAQSAAEATGLTEAQAIELALLDTEGTVLEAELDREDGVQVYEIEILGADGLEREILVHAATGDILAVEVEDDDHDCKKEAA